MSRSIVGSARGSIHRRCKRTWSLSRGEEHVVTIFTCQKLRTHILEGSRWNDVDGRNKMLEGAI